MFKKELTNSTKQQFIFVLGIILFLTLIVNVRALESKNCPVAAYGGDLIRLLPEAYDPDPEIGPAGKLVWEFSIPFDSNGLWQTTKGMTGIFPFWVSVSDGDLKDVKQGCVELFSNNRNPILDPVSEITITQGKNEQISATCFDPDGDKVDISFKFKGKDVAYIIYEPAGLYDLEITCTDGFGGFDKKQTVLRVLKNPDNTDVFLTQSEPKITTNVNIRTSVQTVEDERLVVYGAKMVNEPNPPNQPNQQPNQPNQPEAYNTFTVNEINQQQIYNTITVDEFNNPSTAVQTKNAPVDVIVSTIREPNTPEYLSIMFEIVEKRSNENVDIIIYDSTLDLYGGDTTKSFVIIDSVEKSSEQKNKKITSGCSKRTRWGRCCNS